MILANAAHRLPDSFGGQSVLQATYFNRNSTTALTLKMRGISKAVDRASTSLMQKAGFVEKTVDKDFDDEEKRYRTYEYGLM